MKNPIGADNHLQTLPGIGEKLVKLYVKLGITTIEQLTYYFPHRYEDYSDIILIKDISPGPVTLCVSVESVGSRYARRGLHITEALVRDKSSSIKIIWFNQPYRTNSLLRDKLYYLSGNYEFHNNRYSIVNPTVELVSNFPRNTARIVPIYRETKGLTSRQIRKNIEQTLPLIDTLIDPLPDFIIENEQLLTHAAAVRNLHFPGSSSLLAQAKERIGFEEVYQLILAAQLNKRAIEQKHSTPIPIVRTLATQFADLIPFKLTDAQRTVAWRVLKDMATNKPMNRLVEGDVGSGKTIVAAFAALMVVHSGKQVAYMAPTEILARQQYDTLGQLLGNFGVKVALFTGSIKGKERLATTAAIENGEVHLIIGTHALIQKHPKFRRLALVIIDEQHRFGVNQREKLLGKASQVPHVLTMTATPIPRSLALTVYGELDISTIDQLPPGRIPVITRIVSASSRAQLYDEVDKHIADGRQAYVICPLVDESDVLGVKSVQEEAKLLNQGAFKHRRIGLMHGQLKSEQKEQVMRQFLAGELDILVSTTVVEVGVNVPNATVMIIEGAERFGLAQLHQLRGRIRRSSQQGYCYVVPSTGIQTSKRLRAFIGTDDGFALAELDLELRGPGQIYGLAQHGALDLRFAKLNNTRLLARARAMAIKTIDEKVNLLHYPRLAARVNELKKITNLN